MTKRCGIFCAVAAGALALAGFSMAATHLIDRKGALAGPTSDDGQSSAVATHLSVTSQGNREMGFYEEHVKRPLDFACALVALVGLSPVIAGVAALTRVKLGLPVIFKQTRPGKDGRLFEIYKFRSMTDARDASGKLLSDEERLTGFGAALRETSLDELPELINILKGEMAIVGPRPQLVRDVVFMNDEQKMRQSVLPGLTGLAQVNGRNGISWDDKLAYDIAYLEDISLKNDARIILQTIRTAILQREGVTDGMHSTALDYGEELLRDGKINEQEFQERLVEAKEIVNA